MEYFGYDMTNFKMSIDSQYCLYILDCEMVTTKMGFEIAEIMLMDKDHNIVYHQMIKPKNEILDYITYKTGYTTETFANITKLLDNVIDDLTTIIHHYDIIGGHSLMNDLRVLGFKHSNIIDTQQLYMHPDGPPSYHSLEYLAEKHLNLSIQQNYHSVLEDCNAVCSLIIVSSGYIKSSFLGKDVVFTTDSPPSIKNIQYALNIPVDKIIAVFLRGSRAMNMGTI